MQPGLVRFVLLGGFLGAGKTTAIARLAGMFEDRGLEVGIITNDQADELVDTGTLAHGGFAVEQVAGACFCCDFHGLVRSAETLITRKRPRVILAEPVGSCADIVATVVRPLMKLFQSDFELAPYGVLLKPEYARLILGEDDATIRSDAAYIFGKQLEEADYIAINKVDALTEDEYSRLARFAEEINPQAEIVPVSARTGRGFDRLMELIDGPGAAARRGLELDYDRYARGEAELGWLNSRFDVSASEPFSLDDLLCRVGSRLASVLKAHGAEVAHLKISARSGSLYGVLNQVDEGAGELSIASRGEAAEAQLIVNARVVLDPAVLEREVTRAVERVCSDWGLQCVSRVSRSFRPGRPVPVHRLVSVGGETP